MLYQDFLQAVQKLFPENNSNITGDEVIKEDMWQFLVSCFSEHQDAIEWIMKLGYSVDNCYFREVLSGDHPIITLDQQDLFHESVNSGKSDIIPSVTFSLPNQIKGVHESDMRILRVEFGKPGMAPID